VSSSCLTTMINHKVLSIVPQPRWLKPFTSLKRPSIAELLPATSWWRMQLRKTCQKHHWLTPSRSLVLKQLKLSTTSMSSTSKLQFDVPKPSNPTLCLMSWEQRDQIMQLINRNVTKLLKRLPGPHFNPGLSLQCLYHPRTPPPTSLTRCSNSWGKTVHPQPLS